MPCVKAYFCGTSKLYFKCYLLDLNALDDIAQCFRVLPTRKPFPFRIYSLIDAFV